jgi:hypothetical protein
MDARNLITLVRLVISKIFIKAIFWLAILIFIASLLPWTRGIYDHIFPRPELRITESSPSQDSQAGNKWLYQHVAVVENRGNSTANQVYVTASLPGGRINKYEVFADHPYTVHPNTDISRGYLVLALDRLSPGARITVYLWGSQVEYMQSNRMFAAVYDAGSAPSTGEPSSEEQIRGFIDMILANFEESLALIADKVIGPEGIRNHELAFGDISIPIPEVPSHLVISAITLAVLAWLFLDSVQAALVHGGLVSGMCWLLVPPLDPSTRFMILCTVPFFLLLALRTGSIILFLKQIVELFLARDWKPPVKKPLDTESWWMLSLSVLFLVFVLIDASGKLAFTHEVTDCITAGYLATMLSLELL